MTTVKEDLQTIAKALSALAKDLNKIGRKTGKLEAPAPTAAGKTSAKKKATVKKAVGKKAGKAAKAAELSPASNAPEVSVLDQVFDAVRRSRTGATITKLKEKTGLDARQLSNALYKLTKRGKIESLSRGTYVKKKA
jgi:predicted Rossmann fold nucleotide-binding protein DprA/Smf involved in DNA uptake